MINTLTSRVTAIIPPAESAVFTVCTLHTESRTHTRFEGSIRHFNIEVNAAIEECIHAT